MSNLNINSEQIYNSILQESKTLCDDLNNDVKDCILNNLNSNNVKNAVLDVIIGDKSLEELKAHGFPALLNKSNGILYSHEISSIQKYFLIVWKDNKVEPIIMSYNIEAKGIQCNDAETGENKFLKTNDSSILNDDLREKIELMKKEKEEEEDNDVESTLAETGTLDDNINVF